MSRKVVARYQDGRIVKGTSMDVDPNRPSFHVRPESGPVIEIALRDLKALFFVRSLEGDSTHDEGMELAAHDPRSRGSTLVRLGFADGETIVGLTISYPPRKQYFFVNPVDTASNNIRILVNRDAVTEMVQAA